MVESPAKGQEVELKVEQEPGDAVTLLGGVDVGQDPLETLGRRARNRNVLTRGRLAVAKSKEMQTVATLLVYAARVS